MLWQPHVILFFSTFFLYIYLSQCLLWHEMLWMSYLLRTKNAWCKVTTMSLKVLILKRTRTQPHKSCKYVSTSSEDVNYLFSRHLKYFMLSLRNTWENAMGTNVVCMINREDMWGNESWQVEANLNRRNWCGNLMYI